MKKSIINIMHIIKYIFIYLLIMNVGYFVFKLSRDILKSKYNFNLQQEYNIMAVEIFTILVILLIYKISHKSFFYYCRYKRFSLFNIIPTLFITIALCLLTMIIIPFIIKFFPSYNNVNLTLQNSMNNTIGIVTVLLIAPIFEETMFRGLIFNKLRERFNIYIAIIFQALIFGIFHGNMLQFLYTFILGLVLGIIVFKTDSIIASIAGHICYNLFGTFVFPNLLPNINSYIIMSVLCILSLITIIISMQLMGKRSEKEAVDITNLFIN